jgi:hypothetical protein
VAVCTTVSDLWWLNSLWLGTPRSIACQGGTTASCVAHSSYPLLLQIVEPGINVQIRLLHENAFRACLRHYSLLLLSVDLPEPRSFYVVLSHLTISGLLLIRTVPLLALSLSHSLDSNINTFAAPPTFSRTPNNNTNTTASTAIFKMVNTPTNPFVSSPQSSDASKTKREQPGTPPLPHTQLDNTQKAKDNKAPDKKVCSPHPPINPQRLKRLLAVRLPSLFSARLTV